MEAIQVLSDWHSLSVSPDSPPSNDHLPQVLDFSMPLFMARTPEGKSVSLSDHEALLATFLVGSRTNVDNRLNQYNQSLPRHR